MERSISEILHENAVYQTKLWASKKKQHTSAYFILIDTKCRPSSEFDKQRIIDYCDEIMREFSSMIHALISFNFSSHKWTSDYIDSVSIKYVVEIGPGKLKKDGTRGKSGGTVHIHVYLVIRHHSNITLHWEDLKDFFKPRILHHLGTETAFVSRPRLIPQNRIEEYMEKTFENAVWKNV